MVSHSIRLFVAVTGACLCAILPLPAAIVGSEKTNLAIAPFLIKSWGRPDGLPQNSVQAITQTRDGYLWIGTRGGLARFDGTRFTTYGREQGLKGLNIVDLLDDGRDGLWIATEGGGLSYWRDGEIATVTTAEGLAHNTALVLAQAEKGAVWVGSAGGLQHWGTNGFIRVGKAEGLPDGEVISLAVDKESGLWVGIGSDGGLFYCRNGRCEEVAGLPGLRRMNCYSLLVDTTGDLWASIGNGRVLRRHAGEWTEFNRRHGLPFSFIYCLAQGAPGEVWAGSQEEGLYIFREGRFHPVSVIGGELEPAIRALKMSRDGLIWVGTQAGGLSRLAPRSVTAYPVGQGAKRGQTHGFVEGPSGNFWVTTYGGGLFRGELDKLERVSGVKDLDERPFLLAGLRMKSGTIYLGGITLLVRIDPGTSEIQTTKCAEHWTALCEGDNAELWLGTREGELKRLVDGVPQLVTAGLGRISGLVFEPGPALWIATQGKGLFRWEKGHLQHWGQAEGLPIDVLRTLHRDAEGILWIGTAGGGLAWMREKQLHSVDNQRGLGDDFVNQIIEDDEANLWLGTHRGIIRVAKSELRDLTSGRAAVVHPLVLDESDGMMVAECTGGYSPAGLRSQSGTLYFSTVRGVVALDPKRIGKVAVAPPRLRIEDVKLDGKSLPLNGTKLLFSPGPRELDIRYTAFNYLKSQQIRFRQRLTGLSAEWLDVGSQRSARFPLLPPGEYTFEVLGANQDGHWSETAAGFSFVVQSFFWQTQWFRFLMIILLMTIGGGVVAGLTQSRIRRAQLRETIARADAEAQAHKNEVAQLTRLATLGELSATLAHELNQPLAAIMSNAQAAQRFLAQDHCEPAEIRDILHDIVADDHRASEVICRVRMLLQRSAFQAQPLEANAVIQEVLRLMKGDLKAREVSVVTELGDGLPSIRGDRVQLQQVLINLVFNASDAMKEVSVTSRTLTLRSTAMADGGVQISVADTGSGVPPGAEEKIFEAFHTTKADGLGLGLSLSRSIVLAHGGCLWAENRAGGGATFCFTLSQWKG